MEKSYSVLYDEYVKRHDNKPKYDFAHFIVVLARFHHHRELIRPKIRWWQEAYKSQGLRYWKNYENYGKKQ